MSQTRILSLAFTSLDLQSGLDDIAGSGKIRGRHTGDGARGEELHDAKFLVGAFAEEVAFQVIVGREVDGGEGDIAEEAGGGAFVEAHEAEVLDDPHGGAAGDVGRFGDFALDLEADFDDFEGVGEDLVRRDVRDMYGNERGLLGQVVDLQLGRHQQSHRPGARTATRSCRCTFLKSDHVLCHLR